jgi:hypothetical protein
MSWPDVMGNLICWTKNESYSQQRDVDLKEFNKTIPQADIIFQETHEVVQNMNDSISKAKYVELTNDVLKAVKQASKEGKYETFISTHGYPVNVTYHLKLNFEIKGFSFEGEYDNMCIKWSKTTKKIDSL